VTWWSAVGQLTRKLGVPVVRPERGDQVGIGVARNRLRLIRITRLLKSLSECKVGVSDIAGRDSRVGFVAKQLKGSSRVCGGGFGVTVAEFNPRPLYKEGRKIRGTLTDPTDRSLIERDGLMREVRGGSGIALS
jgi:hypothetical protein